MTRTVRLQELCQIQSGGTPSRDDPAYYGGPIPWAKISDLDRADGAVLATEESLSLSGFETIGGRLFPTGTILLAMYGSVGKVAVAGIPLATNQAILGIRIRHSNVLDSRYLLRWLESIRSQLVFGARGVSQQNISASIVRGLIIPLPPLAEQRRIAALVDTADAVRRKRRESARLLDEFLRSAYLERFGDPIRNEKGWPTSALGDIAQVERGRFTPRPRNDPRFYGGAEPFIQTGDIASAHGMLTRWRQTLNASGAAVSRRFPKGTIALAIAANIGDTALIDFDFYCPDSVVGIVAKPTVLPDYLEMCLRFLKPTLVARAPMTAQRNINLKVLRPLLIPVPPVPLQAWFGAVRQSWRRLADRNTTAMAQHEMLQQSITHDAFDGLAKRASS